MGGKPITSMDKHRPPRPPPITADPYNPWNSGLLNRAGIRATAHCPEPDPEDDIPGWTTAQSVLGWSPPVETEPDVQTIPILRKVGAEAPRLRLFDTWFLARKYRG